VIIAALTTLGTSLSNTFGVVSTSVQNATAGAVATGTP
jgi:Flp pilus assembly pilin Flp